MPHTTCAHCEVEISDHSTMAQRDGKTFCCQNCASAALDQQDMNQHHQAAMGTCSHCHVPIVDPATRVEQDGAVFCCSNCAAAMSAPTGHR